MALLRPKVTDYSNADKQDFKVRLANVKLKKIDFWTKKESISQSGGAPL